MTNPLKPVKNFVSTHKAPLALVAGITIGVAATNNAHEWKELFNETDETVTAA